MKEIAVPKALIAMSTSATNRVNDLQRRLWLEFKEANEEMMTLLGLDPEEGWRLDMERMVYVQTEQSEPIE